ncbi:MAG: sulfite exporter TauE/SafE family protein [Alphaproteobacteria bacterium]|nr:sulfite exporter TauE/SafE family protein [Alphaproteobacteria bacterium]
MSFDPSLLLPPGLDIPIALGLVALSFVTSAITAAFALGGGMLLLSVMVIVLPVSAIVPVHGLVQLGSNAGRAMLRRHQVDWSVALPMIVGAVPGALVGGQFVSLLPENVFALAIGLFILVTSWVRMPRRAVHGPAALIGIGTLIGAIGMIVSATGPLTALFLTQNPDRRVIVATHAAIMTGQHLSKIAVFAALGFVIGPWLPLAAAMIVAGLFGTWSGSHLLERLPERVFRLGLKGLLTLIALDLVRRGLFG